MKSPFKFKIRHYKKIDSTNTKIRQFALKGVEEGLVLTADFQTEGRGKPGTVWVSPPKKNLLFSLLIRPPIAPHKAPLITQIACRSVAKILEKRYSLYATFKRPNDVFVNDKKICGVLVETSTNTSGHLEWMVIGIGLNVNACLKELPPHATSLKEILYRAYSLPPLLQALLTQLRYDIRGFYVDSP